MEKINNRDWDRIWYERFRLIRDKYNDPIIKKLDDLKITPDQISWFRFFMAFAGLWFIGDPGLDWGFIIIYCLFLLFDTWDGALARYKHISSQKGEVLDLTFDILIKVLFLLRLVEVGYLDGFIGSAVIGGFLINFFIASINAFKNKISLPLFPTSDVIIVLYIIFVFWGWNWLDYGMMFLSVYYWIKNIFVLNEFIYEFR